MILKTTSVLDTRINSWSSATKQPPEMILSYALEQYLDDWEDLQDAIRICNEVDSGQMKVYSLDEVEKHLDEINSLES